MPGFKPFRKLITPDRELNLIQDYLVDTFSSLSKSPLLNSKVISQVVFNVGDNTVSHGLGRNYVSWAIMNPTAALTLFAKVSPDASKFILINSSAAGAADILVF